MKIGLIFTTKYGSTKVVAKKISNHLEKKAECDIAQTDVQDIEKFDKIILGIPIYAGSTTREMRMFLKKNWDIINPKIAGIFVLCWDEKNTEKFIENILPGEINKEVIISPVGGEINPDLLIDVEKSIIYDLIGITEKTSTIKDEKIDSFVQRISDRLSI